MKERIAYVEILDPDFPLPAGTTYFRGSFAAPDKLVVQWGTEAGSGEPVVIPVSDGLGEFLNSLKSDLVASLPQKVKAREVDIDKIFDTLQHRCYCAIEDIRDVSTYLAIPLGNRSITLTAEMYGCRLTYANPMFPEIEIEGKSGDERIETRTRRGWDYAASAMERHIVWLASAPELVSDPVSLGDVFDCIGSLSKHMAGFRAILSEVKNE